MYTVHARLTPEVVEDLREMENDIEARDATEGLATYQLEELEQRDREIMEDVSRYPARVWNRRFRSPLERWTATEMLLSRRAISRAYMLEALELGWVGDQLEKKAKGEEADGLFVATGAKQRMRAFRRTIGAALTGQPISYARNFFKVAGEEEPFQDDGNIEFRAGWREAWTKASEEKAVASDIQAINAWIDGLSEEDRRFFLQSHLSPKFEGLSISPEVQDQDMLWWNPSPDEPLPRFVQEERPRVDAQIHDFVVKKTGYDIDRCQAPEKHLELLARTNLSGYHVCRKDSGATVGQGMTRQDLSKACLWKHFDIRGAVSNWVERDLARIKKARERKELWQPVFEAAKALYLQARNCKARKATEAEMIAAAVVLLFDTATSLPKDRVMSWAGFTEMPQAVPVNGDLEKVKSAVFSAKKAVKEAHWRLLDAMVQGLREAGACISKRQATESEGLAAAAIMSFCAGSIPSVNLASWGGFDDPSGGRKVLAGRFDPEELRKVFLTARKQSGSGKGERQ